MFFRTDILLNNSRDLVHERRVYQDGNMFSPFIKTCSFSLLRNVNEDRYESQLQILYMQYLYNYTVWGCLTSRMSDVAFQHLTSRDGCAELPTQNVRQVKHCQTLSCFSTSDISEGVLWTCGGRAPSLFFDSPNGMALPLNCRRELCPRVHSRTTLRPYKTVPTHSHAKRRTLSVRIFSAIRPNVSSFPLLFGFPDRSQLRV